MNSPFKLNQCYGQYSLGCGIINHLVKLSPAYNYCDLTQSTVAR